MSDEEIVKSERQLLNRISGRVRSLTDWTLVMPIFKPRGETGRMEGVMTSI